MQQKRNHSTVDHARSRRPCEWAIHVLWLYDGRWRDVETLWRILLQLSGRTSAGGCR